MPPASDLHCRMFAAASGRKSGHASHSNKSRLMMVVISPLSRPSMMGNPSDSVLSITHSQQRDKENPGSRPRVPDWTKYEGSDNNRRHMPDAVHEPSPRGEESASWRVVHRINSAYGDLLREFFADPDAVAEFPADHWVTKSLHLSGSILQ